jgi:hypothetical protein
MFQKINHSCIDCNSNNIQPLSKPNFSYSTGTVSCDVGCNECGSNWVELFTYNAELKKEFNDLHRKQLDDVTIV